MPPMDTGTDAAVMAPFDVVPTADKWPVLQGTSATLDVSIVRSPGFSEAVVLTASDLPPGTTLAPVTVGPAETKVTLTVSAATTAPHSLPTAISIVGSAGATMVSKPVTMTVTGLPGALDTSFATGGKARIAVGAGEDMAYAVAVQQDGKVLVTGRSAEHGGDFAVVRLDRDGALDPSFGSGGKVTVDVGGGSDTARAVAVQSDGKILLAGSVARSGGAGQTFGLVRLSPDGSLDAAFGAGGKITTSFGQDSDTAYALLVQADGAILVGGDSNQGSSTTGLDFALARYTSDGSLDATFGTGGKVLTALSSAGGRDSIYALTVEDVGGAPFIVAAGGEGDFMAARYDMTGALDPTFGNAGKVSGLRGSVIGAARAVKVTPAGKLLLAGHDNHHFALVQLTADGKPDAAFGTQGKVTTMLSPTNWDEIQDMVVAADGKIVAAGWAYEGSGTSGNFAVVRYAQDGQPDGTFGVGGVAITAFAETGKSDVGMAVALQVDPRVPTVRAVTAGYANGANNDFAVIRVWQ